MPPGERARGISTNDYQFLSRFGPAKQAMATKNIRIFKPLEMGKKLHFLLGGAPSFGYNYKRRCLASVIRSSGAKLELWSSRLIDVRSNTAGGGNATDGEVVSFSVNVIKRLRV